MSNRRAVSSLLVPKSGSPLILGTPELDYQLVRMKGRVAVETGLSEKSVKARVKWGTERFINWMIREGAIFKGGVAVAGPFNHIDPEARYGVALDVPTDAELGWVDYVVSALFLVKEHIMEVQIDENTDPNTILNPYLRAEAAREKAEREKAH